MICNINVPSDFYESEGSHIYMILSDAPHLHEEIERTSWDHIPHEKYSVLVSLSSIHATLHPAMYSQAIRDHSAATSFAISCGSTSSQVSHHQMNNFFIDGTMEITVDGFTATKSKGIRPIGLTKFWGTDIKTARRTLEVTTQLRQQDSDSTLSCNFSTNDQMLSYKRIMFLLTSMNQKEVTST